MTFIREMGVQSITDEEIQKWIDLDCKLVWKDDSIEVWGTV